MSYFDFSAYNERIVIPKSRLVYKKKEKSCFVNCNKVSKIKSADSLLVYNSVSTKKR